MKDLLKTSDLGRADLKDLTFPDGSRDHTQGPVDAPIASHFCIATASKLKKTLGKLSDPRRPSRQSS